MTGAEKREIDLLFRNQRLLQAKRNREIVDIVKKKYFLEEFDIPRDCFENARTRVEIAIELYCVTYNTSEFSTSIDTDITLIKNSLLKFQDKYPEYFI